MQMGDLGKQKKQKQKKQKKAKSGGGLLSRIFGKKNKDKKQAKKDSKMAKKANKAAKKAEKKAAKSEKKEQKKLAKTDKKQQKQIAKTAKKEAKQEKKQIKQLAKQEKKGASNLIDKVAAAKDTAEFLAPELSDKVKNKINDKLNLNNENEEMSDTVTSSDSSGEFATASNKEEGFFAKHKGLLIGLGIVAVAGIVTAVIFSKKKPTQAISGLLGDIDDNFTDEHLGYIEPIDLS